MIESRSEKVTNVYDAISAPLNLAVRVTAYKGRCRDGSTPSVTIGGFIPDRRQDVAMTTG